MKKIRYAEAYNQVSDSNSLIRVFEFYGNIVTKKYNNNLTLCEFHNDRNASMALYEFQGTGFYKCLGCGEKGNVVTYVKIKECCEGNEAIEIIYDILGMDITPYVINEDKYKGMTKEEREEAIRIEEEELKLKEAKQKERNRTLALLHNYEDKCLLRSIPEGQEKAQELIQEIYDGSEDYYKAEVINHALYKADLTIEIDKYISEDMSGMIMALQEAQKGKRVLFLSPTGSGKNYTLINFLKGKYGFKTVLVGPNASNIEQTIESYDVPGAYGNKSATEVFEQEGNVKTFTWDKMIQLKDVNVSDVVLVLDEADQLHRDLFREKAIKGFNDVAPKFKGRVDMTGTPTKLDFSEYDYIVEYKQKKQTNYNVQLYKGIDEKRMIDIINKSKAFGMLYNNIDTLEFLKNKANKRCDVISADKKASSELYSLIINNSTMGQYDGCLNTSVMIAGVNINNENITDIIVVGIKDIGTIKQYIARYRNLENVNVHIFNNYNDEDGAIYNIEDAIKREIALVEEEVLKMNMELLTDELGYKAEEFNLSPLKTQGEKVYRDIEAGVYKVNYSNIRGQIYNNYYESRSARQHRILLMEQLPNINAEIIDVERDEITKDEIKEIRVNKKEAYELAIDTLSKHKELMVGYVELMKEDKISDELDKYLAKNRIEGFLRRVELDDLKVEHFFDFKKIREQNKIFTKYVVEYGYNIDFAWKMSLMSKQKRSNIYTTMNLIAYRYFADKIPVSINKKLQEVKIYEFIDEKVGLADYYTKEGIKELVKELNKEYRAWNYGENDVRILLNAMYNIKEEKLNGKELDKLDNERFLMEKKAEKKPDGKRTGMMKIESYKNIKSLKKELAVPQDDYTIENFVNTKVKQYFKLLTVDEKQDLNINLSELLIPTVALVEKAKTNDIEVNKDIQITIF